MLRKRGDIRQIQSVWISWNELLGTVWIWRYGTDNFGVGVFELGVSAEFLSLSHVGVRVCHGNN